MASSAPAIGAQDRQRASTPFQQLPHVYWRQDMQKLNVRWKASSCWAVASRSASERAAAIASSSDESSDRTKFLRPRPRTRMPPIRFWRGATDSKV